MYLPMGNMEPYKRIQDCGQPYVNYIIIIPFSVEFTIL